MGHWFVPIDIPQVFLSLVFIIILSLAIAFWVLKGRKSPTLKNPYLMISFIFSVVYVALLVILNTLTKNDRISLNDRLVAPIYVPLMLFVFSFFDVIVDKKDVSENNKKSGLDTTLYWIIPIWLFALLLNTVIFTEKHYQEGAYAPNTNSFTKASFQENPLVKWLFENPSKGLQFSNHTNLVYAFTWKNTLSLPENTIEADSCLSLIKKNGTPCYFIMFTFISNQEEKNKLTFLENFISENFVFEIKYKNEVGLVIRCEIPSY